MNLIDTLSDDGTQLVRVLLDDGSTVQLTLVYRAATQRWSVDVLWGSFAANGLGVEVSPNFMRQWRDLVPFGLACLSTDGGDPVYVDDFTTGRCQLYVLDSDDVAAVEADIGAS